MHGSIGEEDRPDAVNLIKQEWIREQMIGRMAEFSEIKTLKVFCGTWNVNCKTLQDSNNSESSLCTQLLAWLKPDAGVVDIYSIGFQEMVDLNTVNTILSSQNSYDRGIYWRDMIRDCLALPDFDGVEYQFLGSRTLVGLGLFIFVKRSILSSITNVRMSSCPTGAYGTMGNKGGVAIRFDYNLSSVCFVCTHFHAHRDQIQVRNADFKTILDSIVFVHNSTGSRPSDSQRGSSFSNEGSLKNWWYDLPEDKIIGISDHDVVFWIGDLNYRIDGKLSNDHIFSEIENGAWLSLLESDQLIVEKAASRVFSGYTEGAINFPPTYKYQPGTNIYERRPDKKLRAPAWCDRILWKIYKKTFSDSVRQTSYQRVDLLPSDHKPVYSVFDWDTRSPLAISERAVYQELLFVIDRWENLTAPKVEVERRVVNFGAVRPGTSVMESIRISNVGGVPARWAFVPSVENSKICKEWLTIKPNQGVLAPAENADVSLCVYIDPTSSLSAPDPDNNDADVVLEDILIVHVSSGSDFFVIVNGVVKKEVSSEANAADELDLGDVYIEKKDSTLIWGTYMGT